MVRVTGGLMADTTASLSTSSLTPPLQALIEEFESKAEQSSTSLLECFHTLQYRFYTELPGQNLCHYLTPGTRGMLSAARQKCDPVLERLEDSPWRLSRQALVETFSESAVQPRFLRALLHLTAITTMQIAVPLLRTSRQKRLGGQIRYAHTDVDWSASDVARVISAIQEQKGQKRDVRHSESVDCAGSLSTASASPQNSKKQRQGDVQQASQPTQSVMPSGLPAARHPLFRSSDPKLGSQRRNRREGLPAVRYDNLQLIRPTRSKQARQPGPSHNRSLASGQRRTPEHCHGPQPTREGHDEPPLQRSNHSLLPSESSQLLSELASDDIVCASMRRSEPESLTTNELATRDPTGYPTQDDDGEIETESEQGLDNVSSSPSIERGRCAPKTLSRSLSVDDIASDCSMGVSQSSAFGFQGYETSKRIRERHPSGDMDSRSRSLLEGSWLRPSLEVPGFNDLADDPGIALVTSSAIISSPVPASEYPALTCEQPLYTSEYSLPTSDLPAAVASFDTDMVKGEINFYDGLTDARRASAAQKATVAFCQWLSSYIPRLQHIKWVFKNQSCPQQQNSHDCGVVVLVVALHLLAQCGLPASIDGSVWRKSLRQSIEHSDIRQQDISGSLRNQRRGCLGAAYSTATTPIVLPSEHASLSYSDQGNTQTTSTLAQELQDLEDDIQSQKKEYASQEEQYREVQLARDLYLKLLQDAEKAHTQIQADINRVNKELSMVVRISKDVATGLTIYGDLLAAPFVDQITRYKSRLKQLQSEELPELRRVVVFRQCYMLNDAFFIDCGKVLEQSRIAIRKAYAELERILNTMEALIMRKKALSKAEAEPFSEQ
ncbi:MAG: hypothetical protein L6R36_005651 [Xanthoria steineri]|nr:MAG: hypothetical protein L6R36_005651 [Xanthoria steineri]